MALTSEDRVAIEQLNVRYAHTTDQGDGERFAACFAPGGVFVSSRLGEIAGAEALAEFARGAAAAPGAQSRTHWVNTVLTEEREDHVAGRCYAMVVEGGAQPRIVASVVYEDELVRIDDGDWRFRRRAVQIVG